MLAYLHRFIVPACYDVLPSRMSSPEATAFLLAIALQESKCASRRQEPTGPARGFWQFERGGVVGVLTHKNSKPFMRPALIALCYPGSLTVAGILTAIEHNDVLAAVVARLLLYTVRQALPNVEQPAAAWEQYLGAWNPGKPRPSTWEGNYRRAWSLVDSGGDA